MNRLRHDTRTAWFEALADYVNLKAQSDMFEPGAPGEDAAVDLYCDALDRLTELPAADEHQLRTKVALNMARWRDFCAMPDDVRAAIDRDRAQIAAADAVAKRKGPTGDIIIKRPHPLDRIWSGLPDRVQDAYMAIEAIDENSAAYDDEVEAACAVADERLDELLAVPSRNLNDVAMKFRLLHMRDGNFDRFPAEFASVLDEFLDMLEAGMEAGRKYELEMGGRPSLAPSPSITPPRRSRA